MCHTGPLVLSRSDTFSVILSHAFFILSVCLWCSRLGTRYVGQAEM